MPPSRERMGSNERAAGAKLLLANYTFCTKVANAFGNDDPNLDASLHSTIEHNRFDSLAREIYRNPLRLSLPHIDTAVVAFEGDETSDGTPWWLHWSLEK